jgi:hypothetical protein
MEIVTRYLGESASEERPEPSRPDPPLDWQASPFVKTLWLLWLGSVLVGFLFSLALHTNRLGPLLRRFLGL